jgi:hypothetical protein
MTGAKEGSRTLLVAITVAVAAVAVLAAIVVVAVGGGGELSVEHPDHPPLTLPGRRPVAGTDALLLRLPLGLWGYHKQITDEALDRFSHELTERDTRIAVLEQQLAEARQRLYGEVSAPPYRNALPPGAPVTREEAIPALTDPSRRGLPPGHDEPHATRTDSAEGGFAPPDTYVPQEPQTGRWSSISNDRDAEKPDLQGPPSNPWWRTPVPDDRAEPEAEPQDDVETEAKAEDDGETGEPAEKAEKKDGDA